MKVYEYILRIKDQASDKMARFVRNAESGRDRMNRFRDSMDQSSKSASNFGGALSFIGRFLGPAALGVLLTTTSLKASKLARDFEQTRISFEVMVGSAQQGRALLSSMEEMAIKTPFKSADLQASGKLLLGYGVSAQKIMPSLKMLGEIAGGNADRLYLLSLAFAQTQAAGRLMGQDLLQMVNSGFNPLQTISEKTGISIGKLKKQMEEGAISAQMVEAAFRAATQEGGRFYNMMDRQSETFEGRLNALGEKWDVWLRQVGLRLNERLMPYIVKLTELIDKMIDPDGEIDRLASKQADSFHKMYSAVQPLIQRYEELVSLQQKSKLTAEQQGEMADVQRKIINQIPTAERLNGNKSTLDLVEAKSYLASQESDFQDLNRLAQQDLLRQLEEKKKEKGRFMADKNALLQDQLSSYTIDQLKKRYIYDDDKETSSLHKTGEYFGLVDTNISTKIKDALKTNDHTKILKAYTEELGNINVEYDKLLQKLAEHRKAQSTVYLPDDSGPKDDWKKIGDDIMGTGGKKNKDGTSRITGGGKQAINVTIHINTLNGIGTIEEVHGEADLDQVMNRMEEAATEAVIRVVNSGNYAAQQ